MKSAMRTTVLSWSCLGMMAALPLAASAQDADDLAKQLSNPIASLVSVPMQLNHDEGFGNGGSRTWLNVQPVIPVSIGEDWNMISPATTIATTSARPSCSPSSPRGWARAGR